MLARKSPWKYLYERKLPRFVYISKLDEEHADFFKTFEALREKFGKTLAPVVIPITEGDKTIGIVDIIHKNAFLSGEGKVEHTDIPENLKDKVEEYYDFLLEAVAETSEENMEKYFAGEPFTLGEIIAGINQGVKDLSLVPVFCGSAMSGLGTEALIHGLVDFAPNPLEGYPPGGCQRERRGSDHQLRTGRNAGHVHLQDGFRPVWQAVLL